MCKGVRRALEIGSGSIKCQVSEVQNGKIVRTSFQQARQVLFCETAGEEGSLSPETLEQG